MPTSGEARIRPTSSYNLRSRPLPKTKPATGRTGRSASSRNKENVSDSANKSKKSQIPVPVKTTPVSKHKGLDAKGSTGSRSNTRVKTVPDFAKLHKTWQKSFNKGKACTKKQCTQVQEFDLTKPGTVFQPSYFNNQEASASVEGDGDEEVFQKDDDALQSILNAGLPNAPQERARLTSVSGNGNSGVSLQKPSRQTLGALPSAYLGRANIVQQTRDQRNIPTSGLSSTKAGNHFLERDQSENTSRRKSLAEQQQDIDINFEPDAGALASILNNTGANFQRQAPATRQTIGVAMGASKSHGALFSGRQSQGPSRTSIYFQKPRNKNYNQVYTDFANHVLSRLSLAETAAPPPSIQSLGRTTKTNVAKSSIIAHPGSRATYQSRLMMSAPRRMGTPATASHARLSCNPHYQTSLRGQDETSSPALRAPPSAMKKASRVKEGKAQSVKWADVLSPPGERTAPGAAKDELATALFADEETQYLEPYSMNRAVGQSELQAATFMAKQDEIQQLEQQAAMHRNKLEEMDEIERQLELEIQKLQEEEEDPVPSPPTMMAENQTGTENPSCWGSDSRCPDKFPSSSSHHHISGKSEGSGQVPPSGFLSTPQQEFTGRPLMISNSEVGERWGVSEDVRMVKSPEAAFSHSPGSPFRRKPIRGESEFRQLKPSGTELFGGTSQYVSDVPHLDLQRQFEIAEKPLAEINRYHSAKGMEHQVEVQDPRIFHSRSDIQMPAPQVISQSGYRMRYEQTYAAMSNQQPPSLVPRGPPESLGLLQESSEGSVRNLGQSANSWDATHGQMGQTHQPTPRDVLINHQSEELVRGRLQNQNENGQGREQERVLSSRITGDSQYPAAAPSTETGFRQYQSESVNFQKVTPFVHSRPPNSSPYLQFSVPQDRINSQVLSSKLQTPSRVNLSNSSVLSAESFRPSFTTTNGSSFPDGRPTSWLSSTPAQIQTPHAVQPHSMVKELALRRALPTTGLSGNPRAEFIQDALPIHTPLAMRTMSRWSKDVESGASPVQFVSPIAVRANLTADPTSVHVVETAYEKPHHPSSGIHSVCAPAVTTSLESEAIHFNHLQQTGVRVDSSSASAPNEGITKPLGVRPVHYQETGVMLDPLSASTTTDPKQNGVRKVNAVEEQLRSTHHLKAKGQGSLSLGAELMTSGGAAAFLKSKMKPLLTNTTNQLFQEALLDEECALYACRLPSKFSYVVPERSCFNPVAKILMDGDDMHFVPIQSKGSVYITSPLGSAFNMYSSQ